MPQRHANRVGGWAAAPLQLPSMGATACWHMRAWRGVDGCCMCYEAAFQH